MFGMADEPYNFTAIGKDKAKLKAAIREAVSEKLDGRKEVTDALGTTVDLCEDPEPGSVLCMDVNIQYHRDKCVYYNVNLYTKRSTFS